MQLEYIRDAVQKMKPGYEMQFAPELMLFQPGMPGFNVADWVLEGIIGSAHEFSYRKDPTTGNVIFRRAKKPCAHDFRTYVSPDRLHYVDKVRDGLYKLKSAK